MCNEQEPSRIPEATMLRRRIEELEELNRWQRARIEVLRRMRDKLMDTLAECQEDLAVARTQEHEFDTMFAPREKKPPILEAATKIGGALV